MIHVQLDTGLQLQMRGGWKGRVLAFSELDKYGWEASKNRLKCASISFRLRAGKMTIWQNPACGCLCVRMHVVLRRNLPLSGWYSRVHKFHKFTLGWASANKSERNSPSAIVPLSELRISQAGVSNVVNRGCANIAFSPRTHFTHCTSIRMLKAFKSFLMTEFCLSVFPPLLHSRTRWNYMQTWGIFGFAVLSAPPCTLLEWNFSVKAFRTFWLLHAKTADVCLSMFRIRFLSARFIFLVCWVLHFVPEWKWKFCIFKINLCS